MTMESAQRTFHPEGIQALSVPGRRPVNQDAIDYVLSADRGSVAVILADGMGGHAGGEVAAQLTVQVMKDVFRDNGFEASTDVLAFGIGQCHLAIQRRAREQASLRGMGSTVVICTIHRSRLTVAHVGDSRALLFRRGCVQRLTCDHLHVVEHLGVPENQAKLHPEGHVLSQALGHEASVYPAIEVVEAVESGDFILVCSDGVSEVVNEVDMWGILSQRKTEEAVRELVQLALDRGSSDNCTIGVVRVP